MIIDAHLHLAGKLTGFWQPLRYGRVMDQGYELQAMPPSFDPPSSPAELALAYMDWAEVDRAIVLQHHLYGDQNETILDAVHRWPDRFSGFAYLGAFDRADDADQLERLIQAGMSGLKVELATTRRLRPTFRYDGAHEWSIWQRLDILRAPLILDINGLSEADLDAVERLVSEFTHLRVDICHLAGAPNGPWQRAALLGRNPRVWLDLASLPHALGPREEFPFYRAIEFIRQVTMAVGERRLMWGTDYPGALNSATYRQWVSLVQNHCGFWVSFEKASVLGGAAQRFLAGE